MDFNISATYPAEVLFEISVNVNGGNYLLIYGKHINGYFCCIPNWNIACEMAEPSDTFYNMEALMHSRVSKRIAKAIAEAICDMAEQIGK